MSAVDWESMRLHPYHAERILANVPAFAHVTPLVAAHHERPDGQGYPRGLRGEQLPLGARLLAVADAFDELTHTCPEGAALDPGKVDARALEDLAFLQHARDAAAAFVARPGVGAEAGAVSSLQRGHDALLQSTQEFMNHA